MSDARFADGLRYRIEIPSVEGPRVLEAVLDEASRRSVPVRRVSQGSGVMMLTDAEIRELATLGADAGVEVSLFLGPRGGMGHRRPVARHVGGGRRRARARGRRRLDRGGRGAASPSGSARSSWPTSACCASSATCAGRVSCRPHSCSRRRSSSPCANPSTARTLAELGATTINVSTDLSVTELGELRGACTAPLDVYVEVRTTRAASSGSTTSQRSSGSRRLCT